MGKIEIQLWDEKQFSESKVAWNELLDRSNADPLFSSWEWQHTWWEVFSDPSMELLLLTAIDETSQLVGIAPLYRSKTKSKGAIISQRIQFIGNIWRGKETMKTEMLDFITETSVSPNVIKALFSHLSSFADWDELILGDIRHDSNTYQLLLQQQLLPNCYYRHAESYDSYYIETSGAFENYLGHLGKNSRLSLYNRRKRLEKLGNIRFRTNQDEDIKSLFKQLNRLHAIRWGSPIFLNDRLVFNETLAYLMADRNALSFSTIEIDSTPISIQYNFIVKKHKYNIQSGFVEGFHKKIPLGYLHFGFEIESAFNNDTNKYDMLAGEGKKTPYKLRLTDTSVKIINLQIIRTPHIKALYRLYDYFVR